MYKPGKKSERCPIRYESVDEERDHLRSGLSHRETINEAALERREWEDIGIRVKTRKRK
jgi:hypothetical protein